MAFFHVPKAPHDGATRVKSTTMTHPFRPRRLLHRKIFSRTNANISKLATPPSNRAMQHDFVSTTGTKGA
jgi:hypothetical protein